MTRRGRIRTEFLILARGLLVLRRRLAENTCQREVQKEALDLVRRAQGVRHGSREGSLEGNICDLRDAELDIGAEANCDRRLLCASSVCFSVFKPAIDALVVVVDSV